MLLIISYTLGVPSNQETACDCILERGVDLPICDRHRGPNRLAFVLYPRCDHTRSGNSAFHPRVESREDDGEEGQGVCEKGCYKEAKEDPTGQKAR